jgi:hemoglobin
MTKSKNRSYWALLGTLLVAALLAPASLARSDDKGGKALYDRLGGVGPLSVVVDEFIDRLAVDSVLNANPAIDAARARAPKPYLKFHVTTLMCQVTGGPCKYTGRGMKESHAHLDITGKEWAQMAKIFKAVLDQYKVPAKEQDELFAIVGTTKADIVVGESKIDAKKMAEHLEKHQSFPAIRSDLIAACGNLAEFTAEEKRWFAAKLPDGKYTSARQVMKAIGLH